MWPRPPVRSLAKEDGKTQVSSHLSLLELYRVEKYKNSALRSFITSKTPYVAIDERGLVRNIHLFLFSCVH